MDCNFNFRKAKIGGFNKKDVISYIEKMRNDFFDYKTAVESTIDTLNAKINELEALMNEQTVAEEASVNVQPEPSAPVDPLANINEATSQLKMVADELCRNLSDFMLKIKAAENKKEQTVTDVFENPEVYIEETAKEIFEEEDVTAEVIDQTDDHVSAILRSSLNFSFDSDSICREEMACTANEKQSVLEALNKSSFFC
ncbi:MAG: hypothetical protein IKJ27_04475 [Clostridia bacterium]|nr:hypothetical protein [Clostridia bacterium]